MQVGQHVLCIKDFAKTHPKSYSCDLRRGMRFPVVGTVYTVREVITTRRGRLTILLAEIINPPLTWKHFSGEARFAAGHFRPLTKLRLEDFIPESIHV